MKKIYSIISAIFFLTTLSAQPVLQSSGLITGLNFNLYSLSNVNTANLAPAGANITWDLSSATATLIGTVDFLEMSATPYANDYPAANFAMKFTVAGNSTYSLFNHTSTILEEVANNVGTGSPVSFIDFRTSLVFPFSFNLSNTDSYQKDGQGVKSISNTYDSYGTFIANTTSNSNVVRLLTDDNGNTSYNWWSSSPVMPLFQASGSGFVLWQLTTLTNSKKIYANTLFDLYPNPATKTLNIINKELISKIEIFDNTGKLQFSTVQSVIDISMLKNGIYFIKAYSGTGTVSQKFVKE